LSREILQQRDLFFGERANLLPKDGKVSKDSVVLAQRRG
jgi:hypothetical protein